MLPLNTYWQTAEVKVLYQEDEKNIIGQYIIFCKVYNEQRKKHGQTKKTVTETIRICKDRNVLKEYLLYDGFFYPHLFTSPLYTGDLYLKRCG